MQRLKLSFRYVLYARVRRQPPFNVPEGKRVFPGRLRGQVRPPSRTRGTSWYVYGTSTVRHTYIKEGASIKDRTSGTSGTPVYAPYVRAHTHAHTQEPTFLDVPDVPTYQTSREAALVKESLKKVLVRHRAYQETYRVPSWTYQGTWIDL